MMWTTHLEGGPRRVNHAAVCIGDKIYSFGGYSSSDEYSDWEQIPVYVLSILTLRWHIVDRLTGMVPFQLYGHTTVAYGDKVYMWGGRNNAVGCDTLCCFDTKTFSWSNPPVSGAVPYAADGHSACVFTNKMYVFGGFEYSSDQYTQEVHCLDLDTFRWSTVHPSGTPPSHRDFHTAVAYGNRMYVFGGRGDINSPYDSEEEMYCPQVYYLDIDECKWVTLNPSGTWPEGRRSHSAWIYKHCMYIFGGYNGNTITHFNDLYKYDILENHWELLNPGGRTPCNRRRQACLLHQDKIYMFGGTSPCPRYQQQHEDDNAERLLENGDLHILDFAPTLRTLGAMAVIQNGLDYSGLPRSLIMEIRSMSVPNRISRAHSQTG